MVTNLAIVDGLIEEAKNLGKHRTKKGAAIEALQEYIQRRRQMKILNIFSTIEYEQDYGYKKQRLKKRKSE
ncbi:MAG: type II toxin-antitoxin system VapB family antitoxin [Candidatus Electrothrix sp. AR5]|nr:type II toxin-antitoxin system VapB family antitoxin [Candidatus Electrothrix sp. AR5]